MPFRWERERHRDAAMSMKRLALIVTSIALFGCQADLEQQAAKCKFEGLKTYPNVNPYMSVPASDFIELCMNAAGYVFDYQNPNCGGGRYVVSEKPNTYCCMCPPSSLGRIGQKIERWLAGERKLPE